ncbi:MmcQ/YjbR family DNA-binding protein [Pyxidicoccus sp. MSG2]|uniref:MmcQ/YjbR family DNA-binding protein n=1 Tax=Pyxidicoccus sp. MSG2 TaxID=2996790 RepID=UPI0022713F66|nr:MmcQ/YjbR family DNA-binding protein [Pyxidicoccus sp. MSG2]MCY1019481.1 MmcQ/YjbR family DNA-binding protein [Pyxidicoccus sp. MSG2]
MTTLPATNADPKLKAAEDRLREVMLALPEATEDFPWGHRSGKVKGKMFAILVLEDSGLTVTTKLPDSNEAALMLPFTAPTGYGMGKSGWVTATFKPGDSVPVELLSQWIHESFRAVAPQKVLKAMAAGGAAAPAPKKAPAKKAVAKAGAVKKAAVAKAGAVKKAAKNVVAKAGAVKKAAVAKAGAVKKAAVAKAGAVKKAAAKKAAPGKSSTARRGAAPTSPSKR